MSQWFRVFGLRTAVIEPAGLLGHLHAHGFSVSGHFRGDDQGWFHAELRIADDAPPVVVERYAATEEGIRPELRTWAAWLEEQDANPDALPLMERLIGTQEVFTLHQTDEADDPDDPQLVERLSLHCCRYLAAATDGVYQADHRGFFAADGTLLVPE
jgi:hypothetical protein